LTLFYKIWIYTNKYNHINKMAYPQYGQQQMQPMQIHPAQQTTKQLAKMRKLKRRLRRSKCCCCLCSLLVPIAFIAGSVLVWEGVLDEDVKDLVYNFLNETISEYA
jgi:hypothetical protein